MEGYRKGACIFSLNIFKRDYIIKLFCRLISFEEYQVSWNMDPKVSLLINQLIEKNFRLHLLVTIFIIAGITSVLIFRNKAIAPIWSSLCISLITISFGILVYHLTQLILISKINIDKIPEEESYLKTKLISLENLATLFQKASLLGLLLILIGVFFARNVNLMGSGIAILGLFGMEFILHRIIIWDYETAKIGITRTKDL